MENKVDLNLFMCINHGNQACEICAPGLHVNGKNDNNRVNEDDYLGYMSVRRRHLIGELKSLEDLLTKNGLLKDHNRLTKIR